MAIIHSTENVLMKLFISLIQILTDENMLLHSNLSLVIDGIQRHQIGRYTCVGENRAGRATASVLIQTKGKGLV